MKCMDPEARIERGPQDDKLFSSAVSAAYPKNGALYSPERL